MRTFIHSLLAFCLLFLATGSHAEVVDRVVAVVNDDSITLSDIATFKKKLTSNGLVDDSLLNMYDRSGLASDGQRLLDYLIDERLIDYEVKSQGLVSPIEQVEAEIRNIANARGFDRNQLKLALNKEGIAYSDYQDFIKTSLQRQNLLQKEVTSKIKISDDEVTAYYLANSPNSKGLIYEYNLSHILFLAKNGGYTEALARAQAVREKLDAKIPFETLVSKHSEDPSFVQGGAFGTFKASDFNKEVGAAITQLAAGDVSAPVKMPDGYHIFKVNKKTLVASPALEARREEIRRALLSTGFKKQYRVWIEQKRKNSFISINTLK